MESPTVRMEDVSKTYPGPVVALDRLNIEIAEGEWVAIMGPSGSGKSTLLNLLGCLDRPTSGRIEIDGVHVTPLGEKQLTTLRREKVGLIFQQFHLVPYLSALENVMLAQYFHSMADETEACRALEEVGLEDRLDHLPSQLSGGEQQRVCIARALINSPKILLADEPTGNLDEGNEQIVLDIFQRLHTEGHTIIMVTHDSNVGTLADRIVLLEHGRLVTSQVPTRDPFTAPVQPGVPLTPS
ncbi:MAG: ABC transporter ATP-binding protein [Candidatus Tectomicrobia bacterium]|uniref:ABC transporter ATP-binding protein n=1 Tax=Tectimicrobiota bacterium TaxID=2528274 RepID=A0A932M1L4_UNCTE|nr:ABC transporter ATP-binding protein [Candidatus Tectomicrobia bacterium]